MTESEKDILRVRHILEAIETIERHIASIDGETFLQDELLTNLAARQISIIGEALNALSGDFQKMHPSLPYQDAKDMRNYLVHEYFDVSYQILWKTCQEDLPKLKQALKEFDIEKSNS